MLPSYRNQSIDLLSKSIDWFLYEATLAFNGLILNRPKQLIVMKREQENSQVPEMLLAKKKKTKTLNKFVSETDSFASRSIYISKIVPSSRGYPLWNHCKYPMSMDTCNGSITDIHLCILCHSHNG